MGGEGEGLCRGDAGDLAVLRDAAALLAAAVLQGTAVQLLQAVGEGGRAAQRRPACNCFPSF